MRSVLLLACAGGCGLWAADALSEMTLVRTVALKADTHHVQGIEFEGNRAWVTSVDREQRKGYLQEFSLDTGECLRTVDVTAGSDRFHPGGLAGDGEWLWLPVAEYRRASSAVVQKRSKRTLQLEAQFEVQDHIGCIAAVPDGLIGANWDSRDFYVWDRSGKLLRKTANPAGNGYQDLKFVEGKLVGGGLLPGKMGAIDWLEYPSLKLVRRVTAGQTDRRTPFTNEGMALRGDRLLLLPEDSPSRVFEYRLTSK
jgi:hypothetical protein